MEEVMAIIKDANVGLRDVNRPVLWFEVRTSECTGALQVFDWETAGKIIKESGVENVKDLNGKPCLVEINQNRVKFLRVLKI